jgi:uncharacterized membrane protein YphA (DoxX/SURF4 family)
MPPTSLIRLAISLVWFYEGLWCKVLGRLPHQEGIVESVPFLGPRVAHFFLVSLGVFECALGAWVLMGWQLWWAALVQTVLLVTMNSVGVTFARRLIHDPPGMLLKNFAFVMLIWVAAFHS